MTEGPSSGKRRKPDPSKGERGPAETHDAKPGRARLNAIGRVALGQVPMTPVRLDDPLEGSILDVLIDDPLRLPWLRRGLPWKTRIVLAAARRLKVAMPPDDIRKLREDLRAARKSLDQLLKIEARKADPVPDSITEWLESQMQDALDGGMYGEVDRELTKYAEAVRGWVSLVDGTGYRWNWTARAFEIPPGARGGRPRQLLRTLVKSLLLGYGDTENTAEVRERIAFSLAPFFSADVLSTSKGSPLYNAVEHAFPEKT